MTSHPLDERLLRSAVERWLEEDVGRGDLTTKAVVPPDVRGRARIEAREPALVAGLDVARLCFETVDGSLRWRAEALEGAPVAAGDVLARIEGPLGPMLTAERTVLNILARMCGVATLTAQYVKEVEGTAARLVDTRKTTPGLRVLEKYAVVVGGGSNHRFGLDDGILIKDNHIAAAGSVTETVERARSSPHGLKVEVEVATLEELDEALAAGADIVLLDNMSPHTVSAAVGRVGGKMMLEVSGGVDLANIRSYAETGVDLISVGALTHSAPTIDVAMEVEP